MNHYYYLLVALAITLSNCTSKNTQYIPLTQEENQSWVNKHLDSVMMAKTYSASNGMQMPYRIFVPEGFSKEEKLPLLIHLHGRGERGTDNNSKTFNNIPLFNGPNSIVSPNIQNQYRCVIIVPQCSDKTINEEWAKWEGNTPETPFEGLGKDGSCVMNDTPSESGAAALELINQTIADFGIDQNRVYLTGLSMGGFGTWEFIGRRPDLFAAAIPMAGYSDPHTVPIIQHIPIWIFHGDIDQYNPVEGSRKMYRLLTEADANVKYTEYPDVDHGETFQRAWQNEELIPWLFAQKKE